MEIDNRDNENRRAEQSRERNRVEQERRQKLEPMRTFEAKLSEKNSHEQAAKDSQLHAQRKAKSEADEKQSLIDKILGVASKDQEEKLDHKRVHEKQFEEERFSDEDEEGEIKKWDLSRDTERSDDKKTSRETENKKSEYAEDGHKRIVEKQGRDDGGSGAGGGDSKQGGQDSQGQSGSHGGSNTGSNSRQSSDPKVFLKDLRKRNTLTPVKKGDSQPRFQQNPRAFTSEDLDQIVANVQIGIGEGGEDFFSVELTDKYYNGLQLRAERTPDGVVLKFLCPNMAVRSTFLKHRPLVYARLKSKNVSVFRIDVV